jgi:hypothetical protein
MSELKAFNMPRYAGQFTLHEVYLKSEADKVISELKDKLRHYPMMVALLESDKKKISELKKACNDKDDWCLHTLKELRHHKCKRCLAMAEWCNSEMGRETFACFRPRHTKEVWREEHKYWAKWRKIWFELYIKFKEAK